MFNVCWAVEVNRRYKMMQVSRHTHTCEQSNRIKADLDLDQPCCGLLIPPSTKGLEWSQGSLHAAEGLKYSFF